MSKRGDRQDTGELPEIPVRFFEAPPQPVSAPEYPGREPQPARKKRHVLRNLIIIILILVLVPAAAFIALGERPGGPASGRGSVTILLAGVDGDGTRTDTIMLVSADTAGRGITFLSIPRDTYVSAPYSVPKINSAYGWAGGGEKGMEELCDRIEEVVGFRPDGYALVNLRAFADIVDAMGGVYFDVPQDMYYEDPYQDLTIALKAGFRLLDGEDALGLVRFRSGYAMADLRRVEVQRDFMKAALKQWSSPKNLLRLPRLISIIKRDVLTDLSPRNILWLLRLPLLLDVESAGNYTLPGMPKTINGGSYFVVDAAKTSELTGRYFS